MLIANVQYRLAATHHSAFRLLLPAGLATAGPVRSQTAANPPPLALQAASGHAQ
jgi:hypothetical protein